MGVKDALQRRGVPLPPDFDERLEVTVAALRGDTSKLHTYKASAQSGGADKDDFLTPQVTMFVDFITSPQARTVLRGILGVVFFASYLEKTPVAGSIIGASLDIMVSAGKALTKAVQSAIPPMLGLIPLPFMSLVGIGVAATFGLIMWPLLAMISFSRQDFAVALESILRVIPPPIGNMLADTFTEGNRAVGRISEKTTKLAEDISSGLAMVTDLAGRVSESFEKSASSLTSQVRAAAAAVPPSVPPPQQAGQRHRFSRRAKRVHKWNKRTRRHRYGQLYANGLPSTTRHVVYRRK
jgi:hypothetical protein